MKERKQRGEKVVPTEAESLLAQEGAHRLFTDSGKTVFNMPLDTKAQSEGTRYLNYTENDLACTPGRPPTCDGRDGDSFYDWRLGIPAVLQLVSDRIVVMALAHPDFPKDGYYDVELAEYWEKLKHHYELMLSGVRCNAPFPAGSPFSYVEYRCADIHTGVSALATHAKQNCNTYYTYNLFWRYGGAPITKTGQTLCGTSSENDQEFFADSRREVIRSMPLYELKVIIDKLYLLTHPMRDLSEQDQRIPSWRSGAGAAVFNPPLCLEANGGASGAGLELGTCDGDPLQHWIYDRESGHISNPDLGKCLQISYGIHASGQNFPVNIDDCFGDDWQEWTYDPETNVLLSAMGTVLTSTTNLPFQWPFPNAGDRIQSSPLLIIGGHNDIVFHAENNDVVSSNQQWLADQPKPCPEPPLLEISPDSSAIGCLPVKPPSE